MADSNFSGVNASDNVTVGAAGTPITQMRVYSPSLTPASVATIVVAEQTFTVTGLTTADKVVVNPPAIANATGIAGARVSAADTLAIRFVNPTAGSLTPTAGAFDDAGFPGQRLYRRRDCRRGYDHAQSHDHGSTVKGEMCRGRTSGR
jgi:hypothetical protein